MGGLSVIDVLPFAPLLGSNGKILSKGTIAATPALLVTGLSFDSASTRIGSAYTATVTGSNLTSQTYFDVRYRAPWGAKRIMWPLIGKQAYPQRITSLPVPLREGSVCAEGHLVNQRNTGNECKSDQVCG